MNLVVDIGNTSVKAAIFEAGKIVLYLNSFAEIKKAVSTHKITCGIISKTGADNPVEEFLFTQNFKILSFEKGLKLPITNGYATPKNVGTDRLALMCAAQKFFPKKHVLCIDTGTCITYNFLNSRAEFLGGAIAPGIEMRFKSLHHFTANLPLVSFKRAMKIYQTENKFSLIGNTTESCIISGVLNGIIAEMNNIIAQYAKQYAALVVILVGSGADFFSKHLSGKNKSIPDMQLQGLNYLLELNV